MNAKELKELDAWIAEQGSLKHLTYATGVKYKFSSEPNDFSLVKREIEHRGWNWQASYISKNPKEIRYCFTVFTEKWESDSCINAETEELAGCLAFKEAIECTQQTMAQKVYPAALAR